MLPSLRLAELLCARLCHDLSDPVGMLSLSVDLLREAGGQGDGSEVFAIATLAATRGRARLRLLRAAWCGPAGPMDAAAIGRLLRDARSGRGAAPCLRGLRDALPADMARLVLNVVLLATEAAGRAGAGDPATPAVVVTGSAAGGVVVALTDRRARWPRGFVAGLADRGAAWRLVGDCDPSSVQGPLTALLAHGYAPGLALRRDVPGRGGMRTVIRVNPVGQTAPGMSPSVSGRRSRPKSPALPAPTASTG